MKIGDKVREKNNDVVGTVIKIRFPAAPWAHQDNGVLVEFPTGFQLWRWEDDLEVIQPEPGIVDYTYPTGGIWID